MKVIYTVTVFQKIDREPLVNNPSKYFPSFGERRCVGWFDNFDEANNAVENNFSNIHEDMYNYAIIEKMESGLLMPDLDRTVYKWDKNTEKFVRIDTPIELSKSSNFGIG